MKKTIISILTSVVVLSMLIITPVKAAENTVDFTSQNGQVVVTLNVTDTNKEALSMKTSFQIEVLTGKINEGDVQFLFDESIQNVVKEYRYDNNILTIYISGEQDLFANQQLKLGIIDLNLSDDTKVKISLVEDSIEYVSSTYAKDVLTATSSSIQLGNPTDDSSTSSDEQKPSVEVTEDATTNTNDVTSSGAQTGDTTNVLIYAWMLVASLVVVAYIAKRKLNKSR